MASQELEQLYDRATPLDEAHREELLETLTRCFGWRPVFFALTNIQNPGITVECCTTQAFPSGYFFEFSKDGSGHELVQIFNNLCQWVAASGTHGDRVLIEGQTVYLLKPSAPGQISGYRLTIHP